jgi:hypothetical protein
LATFGEKGVDVCFCMVRLLEIAAGCRRLPKIMMLSERSRAKNQGTIMEKSTGKREERKGDDTLEALHDSSSLRSSNLESILKPAFFQLGYAPEKRK